MILTSDRSSGLACKMPYPGWNAAFKPAILNLAALIAEASVVDSIERISLKYTNIIPAERGDAPELVDFTLKVGSYEVRLEIYSKFEPSSQMTT